MVLEREQEDNPCKTRAPSVPPWRVRGQVGPGSENPVAVAMPPRRSRALRARWSRACSRTEAELGIAGRGPPEGQRKSGSTAQVAKALRPGSTRRGSRCAGSGREQGRRRRRRAIAAVVSRATCKLGERYSMSSPATRASAIVAQADPSAQPTTSLRSRSTTDTCRFPALAVMAVRLDPARGSAMRCWFVPLSQTRDSPHNGEVEVRASLLAPPSRSLGRSTVLALAFRLSMESRRTSQIRASPSMS